TVLRMLIPLGRRPAPKHSKRLRISMLPQPRTRLVYGRGVIRLDGIGKQHGKQILFVDASAVVHRGEKVGLVGPNGAGKSTIFRMIMREEQPDEGQVSVDRGVTI